MVAFVASIIITLIMTGGILWYMGRRPAGAPVTWGEAMLGATYVFFLMFWVYGVVPHQWLTLADNEWNWRPDRLLYEFDLFGTRPLGFLKPEANGGNFPMSISHLHLRDIVAVLIYLVAITGNMKLITAWQARGDRQKVEVLASGYGRPLVKRS
ncbi:MAG: hypothetical protein GY713_16280 [Actinomycetia bacterium]|nr:hypothetical protein [Actinomycetes bacterium]